MSELISPRIKRQQLEHILVGPSGVLAENSRGRLRSEPECDIRTCFQRDVDRITHSKSFRRLKHKTQVFLSPEGDHYRTRLTHTLEVTRIARTISRALMFNEDLTEAMSLGHDLGHTPFGHAGERALDKLYPGGFKHYEQSLRVVDLLEKDGSGLNLCYETRMGILNHTCGAPDDTREATVLRYSDHIAFLNHDLDDALRAGIITESDIPNEIVRICGHSTSRRIDSMVSDMISNSADDIIRFSPEMQRAYDLFHEYMYGVIYVHPVAKGEESKVEGIIEGLYRYYTAHPETLPGEFGKIVESEGAERAACDYISGMTDGYAMEKYEEIYIPFTWKVK